MGRRRTVLVELKTQLYMVIEEKEIVKRMQELQDSISTDLISWEIVKDYKG